MSPRPIVIAHHLMWTLYGWWLPNDPRGSTSNFIRNDWVADLGELHHGRKQIQPAGRDIRTFYEQATSILKHELLSFTPRQFPLVATALGETTVACKYTCYACAIMPDHIHLIIRKHRDHAEDMIENLQRESRLRLSALGLRSPDHPTWTRGGWKVFLDHPDEVRRTISYVEDNPLKIGLAKQRWPFVKTYNDWPLHPGHSMNSPYVKAIKAVGRYPH